jgi:hypothetical protein
MFQSQERYFRRLSRKAKKPAKLVGEIWNGFIEEMIKEGLDKNDTQFLQILNEKVRKELNIESDESSLDKFKKFL